MTMRKVLLTLSFILVMLVATSGVAQAGNMSVWKPISASCARGATVGISASGTVTVKFYYYTWWWETSSTQIVNFGAGMSKQISTSFSASYDGVSVSGNIPSANSVSKASCR